MSARHWQHPIWGQSPPSLSLLYWWQTWDLRSAQVICLVSTPSLKAPPLQKLEIENIHAPDLLRKFHYRLPSWLLRTKTHPINPSQKGDREHRLRSPRDAGVGIDCAVQLYMRDTGQTLCLYIDSMFGNKLAICYMFILPCATICCCSDTLRVRYLVGLKFMLLRHTAIGIEHFCIVL